MALKENGRVASELVAFYVHHSKQKLGTKFFNRQDIGLDIVVDGAQLLAVHHCPRLKWETFRWRDWIGLISYASKRKGEKKKNKDRVVVIQLIIFLSRLYDSTPISPESCAQTLIFLAYCALCI